VTKTYIGIFFGALSALFLTLAFVRSSRPGGAPKAFVRIGLIFAVVSLLLLLNRI